jgi:hypothetical protein
MSCVAPPLPCVHECVGGGVGFVFLLLGEGRFFLFPKACIKSHSYPDPHNLGLMSGISSQSIFKKIGSHVMHQDEFLNVNEVLPVIYLHLFSAQQMRHHVAS